MSYMSSINKVPWVVQATKSTKQVLEKTFQGWANELAVDEDGNLWVCFSTETPFSPVQSLNMGITFNGHILTHNGDIVWHI